MQIPYQLIAVGTFFNAVPELLKLYASSINPKHASAKTLRQILRANKDTVYGREHHFSLILKARTDERLFRMFEKSVAPTTYEDFRPYVERHKHGEPNVLIPGKPMMYATTSGTTSKPKWIPISMRYMNRIYSGMSHVWIFNYVKHAPRALEGGVMASVGKVIEGHVEDGTISGSVSGLTASRVPGFIKNHFPFPSYVSEIKDYSARYYTMMRFAIAQSVTYIVTPNPSTILEFAHNAEDYFDQYIEDIEAGTLSDKFEIEPEIRAKLEKILKPDPKRAAFLREIKQKTDRPQIKDFWPELRILATWKCGNTSLAAEKVAAQLPDCCFYQELGFFASECRFGLVLDDSINTVMFPHYHFYEFVEESDLDNPSPRFYRLHELERGKKYCIFVTTWSGLYRYNMNDLVQVGPKYKNTPTIHLLQKVNGIVNITGEKLYEKQFVNAVHDAEKETGMKVNFFMGFADPEESRYDFYYEFAEFAVRKKKAQAFTEVVDRKLKESNIEYESKRDSLRLNMPKTYVLRRNAYDLFKKANIARGGRDGQYKLVVLVQDKVRQKLLEEFVEETK